MKTGDEYKAALRAFMVKKGRPVRFDERYGVKEPDVYGWTDLAAEDHIFTHERRDADNRHGYEYVRVQHCQWVVPEGSVLVEETYSQFAGTGCGNDNEVGINVSPCHCACGKHTDITLRFSGSLGEVLRELFGLSDRKGITL